MKKILITSMLFFIASTTNSNSATGQQSLREVIDWYNTTRNNCGNATRPAFMCSGIMLRAVETNPAFLPWDPAPTAIANGGISFSWLRTDNNFSNLVYTYQNGYIFYPPQDIPPTKIRSIPILCAFPMDADSFSRDNNGCGASRAYPQQSRQCNEVGISSANQWITLFNLPDVNRYRIQCGWDVRQGQPDTAFRFIENIRARSLMDDNFWRIQNEIRVKTWDTGMGVRLPIHSFFYVRNNENALQNARFDQRRYYELYNEVVPIIEFVMPRNRTERARFNFFNRSQEIGSGMNVSQSSPDVPSARGNNNNQLWRSDYYTMRALTVKIPAYMGMQKGQSIRMTFRGPNSLLDYRETRIVTNVSDTFFTVPRPFFIDAIGNNAQISYSVLDNNGDIQHSRITNLSIERQSMELPIAHINLSTRTVSIRYPGMNNSQIVSLYWYGAHDRDFGLQTANNSGTVTFDIPRAWIDAERGNRIYLIYGVAPERGERYEFSRVLAVNIN
ncbi:hypothetical protein [uncultured Cedecea sp.]|uniref:hypothetical protein n=1 Tax=uncultured Cedecea sp. TaxID=988762 RepID=UPI00260C8A50|nr:hypothetical protein [uncultured Cedecea sp.]